MTGEEDDYTAERILTDNPDPATPGGGLYKVCSKGCAALRGSPRRFVPKYTTMWHDYLKKEGISLDVKDVLVHLIMHKRHLVTFRSPLTRLFVFPQFAAGIHIPWLNTSEVPPIPILLT